MKNVMIYILMIMLLQATFLLDTNLCSNIKANGATIANVGADKTVIIYNSSPKGLETSIYTDVKTLKWNLYQ